MQAREVTLVTAATLYSPPVSHGALAWSSDNMLAVSGDRGVALMHVAALRQGQQIVRVGAGRPCAPDTQRACSALASMRQTLRGCAACRRLRL